MGRGVDIPWIGGSKYHLSNNKEFRFFLIGLNSIFPTLPQSEYTSREVYSVKIFKNKKNFI